MKKFLAIALSLIMLISVMFSIPVFSASAEGITGSEIAAGAWYCVGVNYDAPEGPWWSDSGYNPYPRGENSVTIDNASYGLAPYAIYTVLNGLTPNTVYSISFNYNLAGGVDAGNCGVILKRGSQPAWQDNRISKTDNVVYGTGIDDVANQKVTINFTTDNNTDYFLSLKANPIGNVTFSNFTVTTAPIPEEEMKGREIANGYWRNGASFDVNTTDNNGNPYLKRETNSLTITEGYYGNWALYTCIDLKANSNYEISFNYTHLEPNDSFILLNNNDSAGPVFYNAGDPQYVNPNANVVMARATTEGNKATFKFSTDDNTKYYLVLKGTYDPGVAEVFSNFNVKATEIPAEVIAGQNIHKGEWYCVGVNSNAPSGPYWTGSGYDCYIRGNGTITVNNAYGLTPYSLYTKLTGLEKNAVYTITFNYDVAGSVDASNCGVIVNQSGEPVWQDNRIDKVNNIVCGTGTDDVDNKKVTISFTTTDSDEYLLSIKPTGVSSNITFSNFTMGFVPASIVAGEKLAAGNWYCVGTDSDSPEGPYWSASGYNPYPAGKNSVTIDHANYGLGYYSIYTKLSGLKKNTAYTITFNYTVAGSVDAENSGVVLKNGGQPAWVDNRIDKVNNKVYGVGVDDPENQKVTVNFVTDGNTEYFFSIKPINQDTNLTFNNFNISYTVVNEFDGTAIRATAADIKQGMRFKNTVSADVLENGIFGSEVVEYGSIAAITEYMNGGELVINDQMVVGKAKVKKGSAFVKDEKEVIFETDANGNKTFTAVLVNIPKAAYDNDYSVRTYYVLANGETVYGEVITYSVFDVFYAILNGDNEDDKAVVNDILNNDADVTSAYSQWLVANS